MSIDWGSAGASDYGSEGIKIRFPKFEYHDYVHNGDTFSIQNQIGLEQFSGVTIKGLGFYLEIIGADPNNGVTFIAIGIKISSPHSGASTVGLFFGMRCLPELPAQG